MIKLKNNFNRISQSIKKSIFFAILSLSLLNSMSSFGDTYLKLNNITNKNNSLNVKVRIFNDDNSIEKKEYFITQKSKENVKVESGVKKVEVDVCKTGDGTVLKKFKVSTNKDIFNNWNYEEYTKDGVTVEKGSLDYQSLLNPKTTTYMLYLKAD